MSTSSTVNSWVPLTMLRTVATTWLSVFATLPSVAGTRELSAEHAHDQHHQHWNNQGELGQRLTARWRALPRRPRGFHKSATQGTGSAFASESRGTALSPVREASVKAPCLSLDPGYNRASLNVSGPLQRLHPAAIILLGLLSACGPTTAANTASATASGSPAGSGSPAPAAGYRVVFTASTPSASEIFLYDSASSTPQQLVALGLGPPPEARFVSPQKIAYLDNSSP